MRPLVLGLRVVELLVLDFLVVVELLVLDLRLWLGDPRGRFD